MKYVLIKLFLQVCLVYVSYTSNGTTECFQLGIFPIAFDLSEKCEIVPHEHVLTLVGILLIYCYCLILFIWIQSTHQ